MRIGMSVDIDDKSRYGRFGSEMFMKLKEHGFSSIDCNLSGTNAWYYTMDEAEMETELKKRKELMDLAGITVSQVHGPWRWPVQDSTPEQRAERLEKMKKAVYLTTLLGSKNMVIHPIMPCGIEDILSGDEQKTWDINMEFMQELLAYAKEMGVTICLENMPFIDFSLSKPCDILRFVKAIDDENFKICLDTGHVAVFEGISVKESVVSCGREIRAFHIHDNKFGMDLHMMPFSGNINWTEFSEALKEIEFDGVFSLETAPSPKLSDGLFEEMSRMYAKVAKEIINLSR